MNWSCAIVGGCANAATSSRAARAPEAASASIVRAGMSRFKPPSLLVCRTVTMRSRKPGAVRCRLSRQFCIVLTIAVPNETIAPAPLRAIA